MSKVIVTGVDGNFGSYVASHIEKLTSKENLIFTCPFEEGLTEWKEKGYDCRVANFNHYEGLEEAFKGNQPHYLQYNFLYKHDQFFQYLDFLHLVH